MVLLTKSLVPSVPVMLVFVATPPAASVTREAMGRDEVPDRRGVVVAVVSFGLKAGML